MKIGVHNTDRYVWEVFKTNECTTDYCSDSDGFITVHKVEESGFLVTSLYSRNKLLQGFALTEKGANSIVNSVRNDEMDPEVAPVFKGEVFIFAEAVLLAKHSDLDAALRLAESYAHAIRPGMLDRSALLSQKG